MKPALIKPLDQSSFCLTLAISHIEELSVKSESVSSIVRSRGPYSTKSLRHSKMAAFLLDLNVERWLM